MDDTSTAVKEEEIVESPQEESAPSETTQPDTSSEPTDNEGQDENINNQDQNDTSQQKEEKKSRLDKRIEQIEAKKSGIESTLERLKSVKEQVQQPFTSQREKPNLISEEEKAEGTFNPDEFERRYAERERLAIQQASNATLERINFINSVNDHLNQTEKIKENPEFKSEKFNTTFEKMYELANTRYNPVTNQHEFIPQVTPQQVYEDLKSTVDDLVTKKTSEIGEELSRQASSRPLDPSSQTSESEYSVEDLEKMLWSNPDKVNKILEKKYS